jgi:hypothetical protein
MNGVAREFWAEVYDLRVASDPREERRARPARAKAKKV